MTKAELEALRRESGTGDVGPQLYREIRDVAARVVQRYPAGIYSPNRQVRWDADAVLEVVHECLLRQMKPDQVRLLFGYADDLDALRGMIGKRVRQTLLDLRATDVVDNICTRLRRELQGNAEVTERHGCFLLGDGPSREATEAELAAVARKVSLVPQLDEQPAARAPRVYSPAALRNIAEIMVEGLPGGVRTSAIDRILRQVLTHRIVVALVPMVEAAEMPTPYGDPAVEDEMTMTVDAVYAALSVDQRTLLQQVFNGWTDGQIAEARGSSRPAAHAARKSLTSMLQPMLSEVDPKLADHLATRLYERLLYEL